MPWTARLHSIGAEGAGSANIVVTITYTEDSTKEEQIRSYSVRGFDMKDAENFAATGVAELDRRDAITTKFQGFNDAITAGKEFVLAQSAPAITVADGS